MATKQAEAKQAIATRQEAEQTLARKGRLLALLGESVAERDRAASEVQTKHSPVIKRLTDEIDVLDARLQDWAEKHREAFTDGKTYELSSGWLRFKLGPPKLVLLARWTWQKTLNALLAFPAASQWSTYVKRVPEINKRKLLSDTRDVDGRPGTALLPEPNLRTIGLRVDQDEFFEAESKPQAALQYVPCP